MACETEVNEEFWINTSSENSPNDVVLECSSTDVLQQFIEELSKEIPNKTKINIPKETSADDKIDSFNERSKNTLLNAFIISEELRLGRQKPVMIIVVIMLALQLIAFNVLMFILIIKSFSIVSVDTQIFGQLLDFFKYYVGVVIIELIGLLVTITRNTFSVQSDKIIDKITSFWKK